MTIHRDIRPANISPRNGELQFESKLCMPKWWDGIVAVGVPVVYVVQYREEHDMRVPPPPAVFSLVGRSAIKKRHATI